MFRSHLDRADGQTDWQAEAENLVVAANGSVWQRRILVVEDESLLASLLVSYLEHAGFEARSAASSVSAKNLVNDFDPDLVLIDLNLGEGPSGLQFGYWLEKAKPDVAQVFLSNSLDPRLWSEDSKKTRKLPQNCSFLAKDQIVSGQVLVSAVNAALAQEVSLIRHDLKNLGRLKGLTQAQLATLKYAAQGHTNIAISRFKGISTRAVEQNLQAVYRHLGLSNDQEINQRVEAIKVFIAEVGLRPNHGN